MKSLLLTLLFVCTSVTLFAQSKQTVYDFLYLPVSAHSAALGGDQPALIEDDENLIFVNPALLSSVTDKTIALSYMNYMQGVNAGTAAFSRTVGQKGTWAASAQYINYGKMKETDENNNDLGDFSAHDVALSGYFSYLLANKLAGGITAKWIMSYIGSYNSLAVGVDLGLNYYDPEKEWSLSAVAKNLGGELKAYTDNFESMPFDVQVGVSKRFVGSPFRLSASLVDLNHENYAFWYHAVVGADLLLGESLWVGIGYNARRAHQMKIESTDGSSSHGAGLSFGGGINLERFKLNISYAKYHISSNSLLLNLAYTL